MRKAYTVMLFGASFLRSLIGVAFVDGFLTQRAVGMRSLQVSVLSRSQLHLTANQDDIYFENISLEYCPGCRWMTKAFWMATELLQSSNPSYKGKIQEVTVIPSQPGSFLISGNVASITKGLDGKEIIDERIEQLWDRKVDGGFPPIDLIEFEERVSSCLEQESFTTDAADDEDLLTHTKVYNTHVAIRYCEGSGYLLRAAYYGQELLTTFCDGELDAISLQPIKNENENDGAFSVQLLTRDEANTVKTLVLWDKLVSENFPQVKELKRMIRDVVTPEKDLGHSEATTSSKNSEEDKSTNENVDDIGECIPCNESTADKAIENESEGDEDDKDEFLDDDEAEEARRYFGVM